MSHCIWNTWQTRIQILDYLLNIIVIIIVLLQKLKNYLSETKGILNRIKIGIL